MEKIDCYGEEIEDKLCPFCGFKKSVIVEVMIREINGKIYGRVFFNCVNCEELFWVDTIEED
jgi:hypothetical protein